MILYDTEQGIYKFEGGAPDLIVEAYYLLRLLKRNLKTDQDKTTLIRVAIAVLIETEEDNAGT